VELSNSFELVACEDPATGALVLDAAFLARRLRLFREVFKTIDFLVRFVYCDEEAIVIIRGGGGGARAEGAHPLRGAATAWQGWYATGPGVTPQHLAATEQVCCGGGGGGGGWV
jgi:hypothetical protein